MFISSEKKLISKDFLGFYYPENTVFVYNKNPINQISIKKEINELQQYVWKVSFPLKSSKINYCIYFKKEKDAKKYLKKIIETYI